MNLKLFTNLTDLLLLTGLFSFCAIGCNKESNERIVIVKVSPQLLIGGPRHPAEVPRDSIYPGSPHIVYYMDLLVEKTSEIIRISLRNMEGVELQGIKGFTYEEGFEYRLKILVSKIINPPADGYLVKYTLLEVLSKVKVEIFE
ncbi:MAG: DUF4377 domain-containing protein [Prevotellaceae bacterium]|jgi:hypothetical protein|nr:DUF4377 domain-containing protein [Prevotellaceae bacterium]